MLMLFALSGPVPPDDALELAEDQPAAEREGRPSVPRGVETFPGAGTGTPRAAAGMTALVGAAFLGPLDTVALLATLGQYACCACTSGYGCPVLLCAGPIEPILLVAAPAIAMTFLAPWLAEGISGRRIAWWTAFVAMVVPPTTLLFVAGVVATGAVAATALFLDLNGFTAGIPQDFRYVFAWMMASVIVAAAFKGIFTAAMIVGHIVALAVVAALIAFAPDDKRPRPDQLAREFIQTLRGP